MVQFRFRFWAVTYIDPDSYGWGHRGTVLFGRMEAGELRVGQPVEVATASGCWRRTVSSIADSDPRKLGKPDEFLSVAIAGSGPADILVYFGSQPPGRDIVCRRAAGRRHSEGNAAADRWSMTASLDPSLTWSRRRLSDFVWRPEER